MFAQKSMTLSVVIITHNEERNIRRCIDSVENLADELIVLDSFSDDDTEKICREYPLRFEQSAFDGYLEQKNKAAALASGDYILSIDADEALSSKLSTEIKKIKQNPKHFAYSFNRLTFFCGKPIKHCGWYPDTKIRIWKKGTAEWGGTNPHDTLILKNGQKAYKLAGDLLHYSYYSISEHIEQINKFSGIKAAEAAKNGKFFNWFKLILSPPFKFFRCWVLKAGFLDGFYGFVICKNSAHSTFLKYAKLKEIRKN